VREIDKNTYIPVTHVSREQSITKDDNIKYDYRDSNFDVCLILSDQPNHTDLRIIDHENGGFESLTERFQPFKVFEFLHRQIAWFQLVVDLPDRTEVETE